MNTFMVCATVLIVTHMICYTIRYIFRKPR